MNPYNIISFIQNKRPKYKDPDTVIGLPQPIEGRGHIDQNGRQGKFVTIHNPNGDGGKTISTYKNNQRNGLSICYRNNGNERYVGIYKDDQLNGKYIEYNPNGSIFYTCSYKNGKINGIRTAYNDDGTIQSETSTKDGRLHGKTIKYQRDQSGKVFNIRIEQWERGELIYVENEPTW